MSDAELLQTVPRLILQMQMGKDLRGNEHEKKSCTWSSRDASLTGRRRRLKMRPLNGHLRREHQERLICTLLIMQM